MRSTLSELRQSLSRNKSMTISLVVTMTVSLLLVALGLLIQSQANRTAYENVAFALEVIGKSKGVARRFLPEDL